MLNPRINIKASNGTFPPKVKNKFRARSFSLLQMIVLLLVMYVAFFINMMMKISKMTSAEINQYHEVSGSSNNQENEQDMDHHFNLDGIERTDVIVIPKEPITSILGYLEEVIVPQTNETSPLQECSPTAQVKIKPTKNNWILQTIDHLGREKNHGGDEMYITYTDGNSKEEDDKDTPPTAVALIEDLNDGTYLLNFCTTPMDAIPTNLSGTGRLKVYFEFTCGIGSLPQPTKIHWKNSGSSFQTGVASNVPKPPMKLFQPPQLPDFGHWPLVVFFGDSTMLQMIKDRKAMEEKQTEENIFLRPNVYFQANIRTLFTMERMKHVGTLFQRMHRKQVLKYERDVSIVIGSAIWDILIAENIQGVDFEDHLAACRYWVADLRKRYRGRTLYWKSPSALHMHRVNCSDANYDYEGCVNSTRYLSNSRVRALHYKQKELMKELNVTYLDLFNTYYLSAHYTAEGDGRHFTQELDEMILGWFYPHNKNEAAVETLQNE